jgi:hypothetical protein
VSRNLKRSLYLGTNFIFNEGLIIRDGGSTRIKQESQNPNLKLAINAKDDNGIPPN